MGVFFWRRVIKISIRTVCIQCYKILRAIHFFWWITELSKIFKGFFVESWWKNGCNFVPLYWFVFCVFNERLLAQWAAVICFSQKSNIICLYYFSR